MTIKEQLAEELRDAMRSRDVPRRNVIRQVETEVTVARAAPGFRGALDDALYVEVIGSYVKKMDKARREFEAAGPRGAQQAAKLAYEIEYLSRWLPARLDEEATRDLVRRVVADLGVTDPRQAGQVVGAIMRSGGQLDGALVSRLVMEELGA